MVTARCSASFLRNIPGNSSKKGGGMKNRLLWLEQLGWLSTATGQQMTCPYGWLVPSPGPVQSRCPVPGWNSPSAVPPSSLTKPLVAGPLKLSNSGEGLALLPGLPPGPATNSLLPAPKQLFSFRGAPVGAANAGPAVRARIIAATANNISMRLIDATSFHKDGTRQLRHVMRYGCLAPLLQGGGGILRTNMMLITVHLLCSSCPKESLPRMWGTAHRSKEPSWAEGGIIFTVGKAWGDAREPLVRGRGSRLGCERRHPACGGCGQRGA